MDILNTTTNAGHFHGISNPKSGWTDYEKGHRHKLSTGCRTCDRARKWAFRGRMMTTMSKGHFHFFDPTNVPEVKK